MSVCRQFWNSVCCLFCVVCSASAAYISLCKGLKYLLKVSYIIQDYPNVAGFLKFCVQCWKHCLMFARHLCLFWHNFTKLSQNMCLITTHILIYRYAFVEKVKGKIRYQKYTILFYLLWQPCFLSFYLNLNTLCFT